MRVTAPAEARGFMSRVLIEGRSRETARLRARITELERTVAGLHRELARLGLPVITEAWE